MKAVITVIALAMALAAAPSVEEGKALYASPKYKCFNCHGPTGVEGGGGLPLKGLPQKYGRDKLMERAAHSCPPTKSCSPKELNAIVDYLLTL
jgi:cytochrome c553